MRNANKTHIPQFDTWFLRILRLASGTANSMHEVPVLLFDATDNIQKNVVRKCGT